MTRYQFQPIAGGTTGFWDDAGNWSDTGGVKQPSVPRSGDTALIASSTGFSDTVTVRDAEYSASTPLGTLGLGSNGGGTSIVQVGGGGSLYVDAVENSFQIGRVGYSGGGTIELTGSGTLSANTFATGISVAMTGTGNTLVMPLLPPGSNVTTLIAGFDPSDRLDLPGVAFAGGVSNVRDVAASLLTFKVGSFSYQFDVLESSRPITAADFFDDGRGGTEITLCFAAGTRIETNAGEVPVETLRAGDLVRTASGRLAPVRWLGRRRIDLANHADPELMRPIRIAPGAIAAGVPRRALRVSPDHAIQVDGALIPARQLVNHRTIVRDETAGWVDYHHVELDRHDILLADGLPAESYLDTGNRGWFGETPRRAGGLCLPVVGSEASVKPVWDRLAARAGLDVAAPISPMRRGAIRLRVGDRSLRPTDAGPGRFAFALPPGCRAARLVCAAHRPTSARPWLDDRRLLGVAVRAVSVDGVSVPLDDAAFGDGWWAVERDGSAFRWTDGDAALRLPLGARVLTIRTVDAASDESLRLVA